ncbi:MAG: TrkH family potassium uptake protein [Candidatus Glassbacteria bacterium]|nr:TrkH family potassium uptake protein [Candidatus Glassbacteria bacterium]
MPQGTIIRLHYRSILSSTGLIVSLAGGIMLIPLLCVPFYPGEGKVVSAFLIPAALQVVIGLAAWRWFGRGSAPRVPLSFKDAGVIVLLSWIVVCLFSAWPFQTAAGFDFTRALFESVSGWTTTGLSVTDVTKVGPALLLWRSTMQLAGGAGLAIIMLSAITGFSLSAISSAEGRSEQLAPHVRRSAKLVLIIYAGYVSVGVIAYKLAGMNVFDAVNHAFAALSTGGFSTRPESIGYWDSTAIEAVTLPLMILGNMSFITGWLLIRGKLIYVARNAEVRLMAILLPLSAGLVLIFTSAGLYSTLAKSVRVALFETMTALTTTGFSTVSYSNWNGFGWFILIVLMLVGGGTCSTAGGIKQYRIYTLLKALVWEIRNQFLPRRAVVENYVWSGEQKVYFGSDSIQRISLFIVLYLATYLVGVGILTAHGYSLQESLFEYASAVGTVGLSVGVTSYTAPGVVLWAETFGMFLGRLEFMVVFVSLVKVVKDLPALFSSK